MPTLSSLTIGQLQRAVAIRQEIEALRQELDSLTGTETALPLKLGRKKRGMSAAGRARVAAAQKARWAKVKGTPEAESVVSPEDKPKAKKRKMSKKAKEAIAAAQKARWAKIKEASVTK